MIQYVVYALRSCRRAVLAIKSRILYSRPIRPICSLMQ